MFKYIVLIVFFMGMVFATIATVMPGSRSSTNPVADIGKEISKPLAKVDEIAPELSHALDSVNVKLPGLAKPEKSAAKMDERALTDHTGAVFSNKDMPKANFAGSVLSDAAFDGALLDGAVLEGADGEKVNFAGARMAKANLTATMLPGADFTSAELREATARGAAFNDAKFTDADISFASFSGAKMVGADFRKIYGAGAFFVGADLARAKFTGADLTGVHLSQANLQGAIFEAADMTLVDLAGANIHGADLSGAINLTAEQVAAACADATTKLPEGMAATRC